MDVLKKLREMFSPKSLSIIKEGPELIDTQKKSIEEILDDPAYLWEMDSADMTFEESFARLGLTLYNENQRNQDSAIKQLTLGTYSCAISATDNPAKEVVNFVLRVFDKEANEYQSRVIHNIKYHFPIMGWFIAQQLRNHPDIKDALIYCQPTTREIDEVKAYREFVNFTMHLFTKKYPDKVQRDIAIKKHFPAYGYDLISLIEDGSEETKPL